MLQIYFGSYVEYAICSFSFRQFFVIKRVGNRPKMVEKRHPRTRKRQEIFVLQRRWGACASRARVTRPYARACNTRASKKKKERARTDSNARPLFSIYPPFPDFNQLSWLNFPLMSLFKLVLTWKKAGRFRLKAQNRPNPYLFFFFFNVFKKILI